MKPRRTSGGNGGLDGCCGLTECQTPGRVSQSGVDDRESAPTCQILTPVLALSSAGPPLLQRPPVVGAPIHLVRVVDAWLRRVPSAAEGLDQGYARGHAPREKIDRRPLILQHTGLRGNYLEIVRDASPILDGGNLESTGERKPRRIRLPCSCN